MMDAVTAILIGRSGCGKGTQAKLLKKYLEEATGREAICISTSDKMCEMMRFGNETSRLFDKKIMKAGHLRRTASWSGRGSTLLSGKISVREWYF